MIEFAQSWGPLLTNVILAAITGWYAYLTRQMSRSAAKSANSAERAVEASIKANDILLSQTDIRMKIRPFYGTRLSDFGPNYEDGVAGFYLDVSGAAITLHNMVFDYVHIDLGSGSYQGVPVSKSPYGDYPMTLYSGDQALLVFDAPTPANSSHKASEDELPKSARGRATECFCTVTYSLGLKGERIHRQLHWEETVADRHL